MSRKITILLSSGLMASAAMNAFSAVPEGFSGFESRINPVPRGRASVITAAPDFSGIRKQAETAIKDTRANVFYGWNAENPALSSSFFSAKQNTGEQMDSIVGHYLDGRLMSKQEFTYTDTGRPLVCRNYLPNPAGTGFQIDGYYSYEYDDLGRLISAEKVSMSGSSMLVEYVYDGDSPAYSIQIAYLPDATGDWMPYQKGEYTVDINYNTTSETFFLWTEDVSDWMPVMKNEATYDEMSRLTSYFPYVWDASVSSWVGNKSGSYEGQRFSYMQNGDDAQQIDYTWENNSWLEYKHTDYTYNESALLTMREELYWNREKQDWSGGDGYGQWGDKKYNSKEINEYDEYGRIVLHNFYRLKKTTDYVNTYRVVYEYSELEDGETEVVSTQLNVASDGSTTTGRREIVRNNRFGGETYYAILSANDDGGFDMKEEEVRHYMPGYHWYLGYESFRYDNGEKIAVSKEEFTYSDDFNPESEYETPVEGRHWVRGAQGLVLKTLDQFTWGPRDVMTGYISFDCLSGSPLKVTGWDVEYDFSADCSKIFMWPDANKGKVFYENKNLSSNEYFNPAYTNGKDEWDNSISSHLDYYYSSREISGVTAYEQNGDAEIIDRFDSMGHRLTAPAKGINIVVYSDGSVKKTMVK